MRNRMVRPQVAAVNERFLGRPGRGIGVTTWKCERLSPVTEKPQNRHRHTPGRPSTKDISLVDT